MTSHLLALSVVSLTNDIGRSLKEGFFMFFETLWALVLGFGLAGAVQSFASRDAMQRRLGNHRPAAVVRASLYGVVSSSCSYAASAMAKSLYQKGADFVASMVFMFASTNLVVELGIVLVVLIGWQFVAAEFVGGAIMIALLSIAGGLFLRGRALDEARQRVEADGREHLRDGSEVPPRPWHERLTSLASWSDAARYTMADLTMLRREMVVGYGIAGFLAVLVPVHLWNALFVSGHGTWTTLENVAIGPFIAVVSFVCSIGNVALAAALWKGGISFGGVVSFVFADLIAMPLLLIYRKLYGPRMAVRMLAVFWALMSIAGLATEGIFRAVGLVPTTRPVTIAPERLTWNYTSILNLVFLAVFGLLYYIAHNRERFGGRSGYAIDPVCGMQVEIAHAPASANVAGQTIYFCSDRCRERYRARPDLFTSQPPAEEPRFASAVAVTLGKKPIADQHGPTSAIDPVCGMTVAPLTAAATRMHRGIDYYFCGLGCAEAFDADPDHYAAPDRGHADSPAS